MHKIVLLTDKADMKMEADQLTPPPETEIKHDLSIRPIFHKTEERIEAHIFLAFLACSEDPRVSIKSNQQLSGTVGAELRKTAQGRVRREVKRAVEV